MIGTIFRALAKNSISLRKRSNCFISVAKTYQKYTFSESLVLFAIVGGRVPETEKITCLPMWQIDLKICLPNESQFCLQFCIISAVIIEIQQIM